jgi:ribonuclease HII
MTIVAGVDEAGRGSVLGPLLVAVVSIEEKDIPKLVQTGVKDSKLLAPALRRKLYRMIRKIAVEVAYERIDPDEIDLVVTNGTRLFRLNHLEAQYMAKVLSRLNKFDLAYVDCCDTVQKRYGELVADLLFERVKLKKNKGRVELGEENHYRKMIISEHHADRNYPVVSAASIVAKVRRDAYISILHKKHGTFFGSGYPSDPNTKSFLEGFVNRAETLPAFTRLSWATVRNLYDMQTEGERSATIDGFQT